jgi:hypothetical protein
MADMDDFELEERLNQLRFLFDSTYGIDSPEVVDAVRKEAKDAGLEADYPLAIALGATYGFSLAFDDEFRYIAHDKNPLQQLLQLNIGIPIEPFDQYDFQPDFYDNFYAGFLQGVLYGFEEIQNEPDIQYTPKLESEIINHKIISGQIFEDFEFLDIDNKNVGVYIEDVNLSSSLFFFPLDKKQYNALPKA